MALRTLPKWALPASLILNLILGGISGGLAWNIGHPPPPPSGFGLDLPPEGRRVLFSAAFQDRKDIIPLIEETRAARTALANTLLAEPFDMKAYDAAAERLKAAQIRILDQKALTVRKAALSLSAEERRTLAKHLEKGPGDGRKRHRQEEGKLSPIAPPSPEAP